MGIMNLPFDIRVIFGCDCGKPMDAYFFKDGNDTDFAHCNCGRKYLVTKPYIANIQALHDHAYNSDAEE